MTKFRSPGKLLITGEYCVLQGAKSLAVPTSFGQTMSVEISPSTTELVHWISREVNDKIWLEVILVGDNLQSNIKLDEQGETLQKLLLYCKNKRPQIFEGQSVNIETKLEFPRDWGLGSSSTFLSNLSQWTGISGLDLLWSQFSGSGCDVATCLAGESIIYQLLEKDGKKEGKVERVNWDPVFKDQIWFIHLGQKQDSNAEISKWKHNNSLSSCITEDFDAITEQILVEDSLSEFKFLINTHEKMLSKILGMKRLKEAFFADFPGEIKSLGAWGGDFFLATGTQVEMQYFIEKGFKTILSFSEMIKTKN